MVQQQRYLTKSRFKLGIDCPTKLFYTGKSEIYADKNLDDSFLKALANGGFQVGELAKCYFPGGTEISTLNYDQAVEETEGLLKQDQVIIYEGAVRSKNLFIRADILVKNGDDLKLIEVKAKSWKPETDSFIGARGGILSDWKEYVYDVAFQKYVIENAWPNRFNVSAFLMFADRSSLCPTDGLNQKFRIALNGERKRAFVDGELSTDDLATWILCEVPADDVAKSIYESKDPVDGTQSFEEFVGYLAAQYESDTKITSPFSGKCAKCEFRATAEDESNGLKSGVAECWTQQLGWSSEEIAKQNVLNIWNFRKKDSLIASGKIKLSDLIEADIGTKTDGKPGLSQSERQWKQVQMACTGEIAHWLGKAELRQEMDSWIFPLHFIDFETTMTAIPFNKGRRPYEGIAFQFSHHIVNSDGTVDHCGEYLNTTPGVFPNYEFIRTLKSELEGDDGSIFRYALHENTYLNMIWEQLQGDPVDDASELREFIKTITTSKKGQAEEWKGDRNMIDMLELVKRHYYDPATNGSNSIKHVLPAILNSSDYLKDKYSQPMYGADGGIRSRNFQDRQWVNSDSNGKVIDPYKQLDKMFDGISDKDFDLLISEEDEIRDGGAAMTAYMLLQYSDMSAIERTCIETALKKYCELDTLAMVMIYEAWRQWCYD